MGISLNIIPQNSFLIFQSSKYERKCMQIHWISRRFKHYRISKSLLITSWKNISLSYDLMSAQQELSNPTKHFLCFTFIFWSIIEVKSATTMPKWNSMCIHEWFSSNCFSLFFFHFVNSLLAQRSAHFQKASSRRLQNCLPLVIVLLKIKFLFTFLSLAS